MAEPVIHDSIRKAEALFFKQQQEAMKKTQKAGLPKDTSTYDPIRSFERIAGQVQTDLRHWRNNPLAQRLKDVKKWSQEPFLPKEADAADQANYERAMHTRRVALWFIIQEESRLSEGSYEVALAATKYLFNKGAQNG